MLLMVNLMLLLPLVVAAVGGTGGASAFVSTAGTCLAGIDAGRLAAGATVAGSCAGHATDDSFVCGGKDNLVEWRSAEVFLGTADFNASASLMLEVVNGTAASVVVLSAGGREDIVNLDCHGKILCSEGSHWGAAHHGKTQARSPAAGKWFNLTLVRASGKLSAAIDGVEALFMLADFSVEGLAIRPWRSVVHTRSLSVCAAKLPAPIPPPAPKPKPKPPSLPPRTSLVFPNGMAAPGLPAGFAYSFGIPALQMTPKGSVLAFCQANLIGPKDKPAPDGSVGATAGDGRGSWTDIALRRSTDGGESWGPLQIICRNSSLGAGGKRDRGLEHSCQQVCFKRPLPVRYPLYVYTAYLTGCLTRCAALNSQHLSRTRLRTRSSSSPRSTTGTSERSNPPTTVLTYRHPPPCKIHAVHIYIYGVFYMEGCL